VGHVSLGCVLDCFHNRIDALVDLAIQVKKAMLAHQQKIDYFDLFFIPASEVTQTFLRQLNLREIHLDLIWFANLVVFSLEHLLGFVTDQHELLALVVRNVTTAAAHLVALAVLTRMEDLKETILDGVFKQ